MVSQYINIFDIFGFFLKIILVLLEALKFDTFSFIHRLKKKKNSFMLKYSERCYSSAFSNIRIMFVFMQYMIV